MPEPLPVKKESNIAATVSIASALVGLLILPIIMAPVAIVAGFIGHGKSASWSSGIGIVAGFGEVLWILIQWGQAGLL